MAEPIVKYCTVREGDSEWHLECRFSDGQKYAAIKIDEACPELATRVAALLNGNVWTDERPTEPGEYWVSIEPVKRVGMYAHFGWPMRATVTGPMCGFNGRYYPLSDEMFDGAKWSRRETPADPFEEG